MRKGRIKRGRNAPLLLPFLIPKGETLRLVWLGSSERKLEAKELSLESEKKPGKERQIVKEHPHYPGF